MILPFLQEFEAGEVAVLAAATTYAEVAEVALGQMRRLRDDIHQDLHIVCGPISTGGLGSQAANLARFEDAIFKLREVGYPVFSQMPYEEAVWRIRNMTEEEINAGAYDQDLLEDFYGPIFRSGLVVRKHFIPGWETSRGARWEHDLAKETGTTISYLGHNLLPYR